MNFQEIGKTGLHEFYGYIEESFHKDLR